MSPPAAPPLLTAIHARIAVDDIVALDDLGFVTRGDRVLLVGEVAVVFAALSGVPLLAAAPDSAANEMPLAGDVRVVAGELRLHGHDVAVQAHLAETGFAPLDPPVPRSMTALAYVTWAARLAGVTPRAAEALARAALHRVGLETLAARPAAALGVAERRALQLAKAIVANPAVIVAEAPLDRLEGDAASFVAGALAAATEGRRALLSARRIHPATAEGAVARAADHLVFFGEGGVVAEGAPTELASGARVLRLTVASNAGALRSALAARGVALGGGPVHFTVVLPDGSTTAPILEAASEARAAVVEMVPLVA